MKHLMLTIVLAALIGCGADGEPETPTATRADSGTNLTLSGSASFGVVRGPADMKRRP